MSLGSELYRVAEQSFRGFHSNQLSVHLFCCQSTLLKGGDGSSHGLSSVRFQPKTFWFSSKDPKMIGWLTAIYIYKVLLFQVSNMPLF